MPAKHQFSQIVRFLCAGGIGTSLYYLILYTLTDKFRLWYMGSAIIASTVNWSCNFVFQKYWTFKNKDTSYIHKQMTKYAILAASIFLSNLLLLYWLVSGLHIWYIAAQGMVDSVLCVTSYLVSRRIFANEPPLDEPL